ncbi:hypothetical protein ABZT03_43355 [Streptomyces sp. NPDC005574]|uniref:hypothetical protein n=1 Tax=Streptomyces sp. NPDC005574 TaxID=3156891 RepID=UPI0033BBAEE8
MTLPAENRTAMSKYRQHSENHAQDGLGQPTRTGETINLPLIGDTDTVLPGSTKVGPEEQTLLLPPQRFIPAREPSIRVQPGSAAPMTQASEAPTVWLPQPVTKPAPEDFNNGTLLDPNAWARITQSVSATPDEDLPNSGPRISLQTANIWHNTESTTNHPRRKRRWVVPLLVLLSLFAFLIYQRYEQPVSIAKVSVHTDAAGPACNRTVQITGVMETDGGAGKITYRWHRSDGTNSDVLTQHVPSGHHTTELMLRWTFEGHGSMQATTTLEILTPVPTSAAVTFRYTCRGNGHELGSVMNQVWISSKESPDEYDD